MPVEGGSSLQAIIEMIFLAGVAMVGSWVGLRVLDLLSGVSFGKKVWPIISQSPLATSWYYSVRFAIVFGTVAYQLGRFY